MSRLFVSLLKILFNALPRLIRTRKFVSARNLKRNALVRFWVKLVIVCVEYDYLSFMSEYLSNALRNSFSALCGGHASISYSCDRYFSFGSFSW